MEPGPVHNAIGDISRYKFDRDAYASLFDALQGLFRTVRDIRRYANELPGTLALLGDEVGLVDVLALEALRVRVPESFALLTISNDALTFGAIPSVSQRTDDATAAAQIGLIIQTAASSGECVGTIIKRLFPVGGRHLGGPSYDADWLPVWRRERRVAHREVFDIYLSRALPPGGLATKLVEEVVGRFEDEEALSLLLAGLGSDELESLLDRLTDYEGQFPTNRPEIPIAVLYNNRSRLREDVHHILDPGAGTKVARVVTRLLKKLDQEQVDRAVRGGLSRIRTLSDKRDLIGLVGSRDGEGLDLMSNKAAVESENELTLSILDTDAAGLASERELLQLLVWAHGQSPEATASKLRTLIGDDGFFLSLLRASQIERISQAIDGGAVRRGYELDWPLLTRLLPHDVLNARAIEIDMDQKSEITDERVSRAIAEVKGRTVPSTPASTED